MRRFYKAILLLGLALLLFPSNSKATHIMGSDITWECLGKDSFKVTLTVYRDCTGVDLSRPNLNVDCDSGGSVSNVNPQGQSYSPDNDITPICDNSKSECGGSGSFGYGIEEEKRDFIVDLSNTNCCKINFNYSGCCRSSNITTGLASEGFYAESWFDRCKAPCNSSPQFSEKPTDILCANRKQVYTQGAVDNDTDETGKLLDSLSYDFAPPLGRGSNDRLRYNGQYSYQIPLDYKGPRPNLPFVPNGYGFHLDNSTGDLRFTPTKAGQVSVMSFRVSEYREINGKMQKIGETRRDVQFFVKKCPQNRTPILTGMDCPNNKNFKEVCEGDFLNTSFCTDDPDKKDTVEISWSPGNLPGAPSFTVPNPKAQYQDGRLRWTAPEGSASPIPYRFSVTAKDDNCPVAGQATKSYQIKVKETPDAKIKTNKIACGTYRFTGIPTKGAGIQYEWSSNNSDLSSKRQTFDHVFEEPGVYPFELKVKANGCSRKIKDTIKLSPFLRVDIGNDTTICSGESVKLGGMPKDSNGLVKYTWFDSVKGKRNRTFKNLYKDTTISVKIRDTSCSYTDKVKVDVREKPEIDLGSDPRICPDDTATVSPRKIKSPDSMKRPPWVYFDNGLQEGNYKWYQSSTGSPAISKGDTLSISKQGDYILEAIDSFDCANTDTLTLNTNPELDPKPFPDKICRGDTSTLKAQKPNRPSVSYTWTNLRTEETYNTQQVDVAPDSTTKFALVVEETSKGIFCRDSATTTIEVKDLPNVEIDPQANICSNEDQIALEDTLSPNQMGGNWRSDDLPDNALNNGFVKPENVKPGQYTVKFEWKEGPAENPRCSNIDSSELFIRKLPTVDAGMDTVLCTHDDPLQLEGSPASPVGDWEGEGITNGENQSTYSYDPGSNEVPTRAGNSVYYTYSAPPYGCTVTDTAQITVQQSPTPDFADQEVCINRKTLSLTNIANKGTWLGEEVSNGTFNTPDDPGVYEARYEISSNTFRTCTVQDTIDIQVKDTPVVKAATESGNTEFCETRTRVQLTGEPAGSSGSWQSINETAEIEQGSILNPAASKLGENQLVYSYRDFSTNCLNKDTMTIDVKEQPEVSVVASDSSKCRGARYRVSAEYDNTSRIPTWRSVGRSDLDGFTDIKSENKTITAFYTPTDKQENNEEFTVIAEAQNNTPCPNVTDSALINIKPVPRPDFTTENKGCPPLDVTFENKTTISEGGEIESYEWKLGNNEQSSAETPEVKYPEPGEYTVSLKATSVKNCEATMTKEDYIKVSQKPEIDFTADPVLTTIDDPEISFENLTKDENRPLSYQWSFGQEEEVEGSSTTLKEPTHIYQDTGSYTVKLAVTNSKGCKDSLVRDNYVRVRPTVISYAPSAFSPNGDGQNDIYKVEAQYFTSFKIQIFNRWGEQVYSSDNYEEHGWDGTYEGQKAPAGVYTYIVSATGMDGEDYTFSGTITLIR